MVVLNPQHCFSGRKEARLKTFHLALLGVQPQGWTGSARLLMSTYNFSFNWQLLSTWLLSVRPRIGPISPTKQRQSLIRWRICQNSSFGIAINLYSTWNGVGANSPEFEYPFLLNLPTSLVPPSLPSPKSLFNSTTRPTPPAANPTTNMWVPRV